MTVLIVTRFHEQEGSLLEAPTRLFESKKSPWSLGIFDPLLPFPLLHVHASELRPRTLPIFDCHFTPLTASLPRGCSDATLHRSILQQLMYALAVAVESDLPVAIATRCFMQAGAHASAQAEVSALHPNAHAAAETIIDAASACAFSSMASSASGPSASVPGASARADTASESQWRTAADAPGDDEREPGVVEIGKDEVKKENEPSEQRSKTSISSTTTSSVSSSVSVLAPAQINPSLYAS